MVDQNPGSKRTWEQQAPLDNYFSYSPSLAPPSPRIMKRTVCVLVGLVCGFSLTRIDFPRDSHPSQIVPLENSAPVPWKSLPRIVLVGSFTIAVAMLSQHLLSGCTLPHLPCPHHQGERPLFLFQAHPTQLTFSASIFSVTELAARNKSSCLAPSTIRQ